jgi:hypothetical protein
MQLQRSTVIYINTVQFFQLLLKYTASIALVGRGISQSQGRYLHNGQHSHGSRRILTHDPRILPLQDNFLPGEIIMQQVGAHKS